MKVFMYALVIALTVIVTLGCVYGFSCVSCESGETETETVTETSKVPSLRFLSDEEVATDEDEPAEAVQWTKVIFDVVVIAMTVGVIILVWWLIKRVTKKYGNSNRRFG